MLLFTMNQPLLASAQEVNEEEQTEEQAEENNEQNEEEQAEENNEQNEEPNVEDNGEGTPVDEENEEPTLSGTTNGNENAEDSEVIKKPVETPASVTGEQYQGLGTVTDFTTHGSREIYTISTPDNSVYYLMIDWDMTENNVYFLTPVNDGNMNVENTPPMEQSADTLPQQNAQTETAAETEPVENGVKQESQGNNATFWILLILMAVGLFGYQFFFGKLKNLNPLLNKKEKEVDTKEIDPNDEKEKDVHMEQEVYISDNDNTNEEKEND